MLGLGRSILVINVTFYKGNFTKHAHVVEKELHFQPMYGRVNAANINVLVSSTVADLHQIYTVALLIPSYLMKPQINETIKSASFC